MSYILDTLREKGPFTTGQCIVDAIKLCTPEINIEDILAEMIDTRITLKSKENSKSLITTKISYIEASIRPLKKSLIDTPPLTIHTPINFFITCNMKNIEAVKDNGSLKMTTFKNMILQFHY